MKILTAIMTVLMMAACGNAGAGKMSDADVGKWCSESEWVTALPFEAGASVDRRAFAEQNRLSPEVWKKAFEFLSRKDLASLAEGTYELDDNGLFATVSYYTTKDSALFEAHRKYIDIQYVAEGCERIDLAAADAARREVVPYDPAKDIEFFEAGDSRPLNADPSRFFVFFPGEGHRPCMKVGDNARVKKIVVKIPYKE